MSPDEKIRKRRAKLRRKGLSLAEIGRREGVSWQAVQKSLGPSTFRAKRVSQHAERNKQILKLARAGKTVAKIAKKLGLRWEVVYNVAYRAKSVVPQYNNAQWIKKGKFRCYGPCHKVKPLEEYGRDRSKATGRMVICKECNRARAKSWRNRQPEDKDE